MADLVSLSCFRYYSFFELVVPSSQDPSQRS